MSDIKTRRSGLAFPTPIGGVGVSDSESQPPRRRRSVHAIRGPGGRFAPKTMPTRSLFPLLDASEAFFLRSACAEGADQLRSYARMDGPTGFRTGVPTDAEPEARYGKILDHLGGLASTRGEPLAAGSSATTDETRRRVGRDVFLYPPLSASASASTDLSFTLDHRGRHETCITLDPSRESTGRRRRRPIVWRDGGGYYKVEVYSYSVAEGLEGKSRRVAGLELVHRLVLWCIFGPPPPGSNLPIAVHMCGNRGCVNPEHLVWGTYAINAITNPVEAREAFLGLLRGQGRRPTEQADGPR